MESSIRPLQRNAAIAVATAILSALFPAPVLQAQVADSMQIAELTSLRDQVRNVNTRVRVAATHRVWAIGLASSRPETKVMALALLKEPIDSASDHIRMPVVYAVAEIAASSSDVQVKLRALEALRAPLNSGQEPIRVAAVDALNAIVRSGSTRDLGAAAVALLAMPTRSAVNAVRMPAINAIVRSVEKSQDTAACDAALDLLVEPLKSMATTGGMEVRMMAMAAVERIGVDANDVGIKAKALGLAQTYAASQGWESEARARATDAAAAIRATIKSVDPSRK